MNLQQEIISSLGKCVNEDTREEYETRLNRSQLTRDENEHTHFCAYFVPYNPVSKKVLIGDHKKSGLWLMPGGHIDQGETLIATLNREIEEELGVANFFSKKPEPFLLTITNINQDVRNCEKHFDVWHIMETNGSDFKIDYTEYNEVRWVTIAQAQQIIVDPASLEALKVLNNQSK